MLRSLLQPLLTPSLTALLHECSLNSLTLPRCHSLAHALHPYHSLPLPPSCIHACHPLNLRITYSRPPSYVNFHSPIHSPPPIAPLNSRLPLHSLDLSLNRSIHSLNRSINSSHSYLHFPFHAI
jgi:hypothetical protein